MKKDAYSRGKIFLLAIYALTALVILIGMVAGGIEGRSTQSIPDLLDLQRQEWAETPYPGDEAHIQPCAEVLRQVARQAETTDLESFTALSAAGRPWLSYDQDTRRITVNPYVYAGGLEDGPHDYLTEDPYVYKVGQPTLPNWEGERPDWEWEDCVLQSFEEDSPAWLEVARGVRIAWTDGLKHRLLVKLIFCGRYGVYPVMYLDNSRVISYAVWPADSNEWWGMPTSRNGQVFEAVSVDGQVLTWDLGQHLSFGRDLVDISVKPWRDWVPTGRWTQEPISGQWYAPHCVCWSDKDDQLLVILGTDNSGDIIDDVTVYYGEEAVGSISIPHSWKIGRMFQGACGCVLAVTDAGAWRIMCDQRFHASLHSHVFDLKRHLFPDCPEVDAVADYTWTTMTADGHDVTLAAFSEPDIRLVAISDDGDDTVVEIDGVCCYVHSSSWADNKADAGCQPVDDRMRFASADKIFFDEDCLVLQIGDEEERIPLR